MQSDMIAYTGCRLEQTERKEDRTEKKVKKFLTNEKRFDRISKLSL